MLRRLLHTRLVQTHVRAFAAGAAASETKLLLRDYLQRSLYDPQQGYFSAGNVPVGTVGKPLYFRSLAGEADYRAAVRRLYDKLQTSWLTPSEIFAPFYGRAIANFVLNKHAQMAAPDEPLRVFEIGGGMGTLARDVLDHVRGAAPQTYEGMEYCSVEISPALARAQAATVAEAGGHGERFKVECRDACDRAGWQAGGSAGDGACVVLALEVLDNCPHDRLCRAGPSQPWQQTAVLLGDDHDGRKQQGGAGPSGREVLEPLSDALIQRCLTVGPWEHNGKPLWHRLLDWAVEPGSAGAENTLFLPTKCMALLEALCAARPRHCLLAADFDALPDTAIPGKNAPLVATTVDGQTIDHRSYLVPLGSADIFFPTDFAMLERMYDRVARSEVQGFAGVMSSSMKSRDFMKRYASIAETMTGSGYNPLLQDFSNTSFFVGQTC